MEKTKNCWVIPTDKPSRLCLDSKDILLFAPRSGFSTADGKQNIYITSDEEIKKGDWVLNPIYKTVYKWIKNADIYFDRIDAKKIILTTDQDLIKDGVQAIDDEFLEWFVKNPSCEEIKVEEFEPIYGHQNNSSSILYKIIIPKEEPKQETLEEAAEKEYPTIHEQYQYDAFIEGAKWQHERMYTEEEVIEFGKFLTEFNNLDNEIECAIKKLLEQFKNK